MIETVRADEKNEYDSTYSIWTRVDLHQFQREDMRPLLITIVLIAPILMSGCTQSDVDTSEQSMGCTYPGAVNLIHLPLLTMDPAFTDAPAQILGCTYSDALNHNPSATEDDGSCRYPVVPEPVPGCTYPEAYNYEINATEDDGTCVYDSDGDGIIDAFEQPGCTDINANNHNSSSTDDDGSCDYDEDDDEYMIGLSQRAALILLRLTTILAQQKATRQCANTHSL